MQYIVSTLEVGVCEKRRNKAAIVILRSNIHNYTAKQKLLHKRRARKSYDLPAKTSVFLAAGNNVTS
jgi:hypothetical protein